VAARVGIVDQGRLVAEGTCAITALVVTLARTDEQADGYSSLVVFTPALLGGNFVYLAQLPKALQRVSLLTPNGWALRGFVALVARNAGLAGILRPLAVLAAFAAALLALATWRLRRTLVGYALPRP
jgi:linearmycin/streptolysin S transport system permease protein